MSATRRGLALAIGLAMGACSKPQYLTPADRSAPRDDSAPVPTAVLDSRAGFGALTEADGDTSVRQLALRFVAALAEENTGQLRVLLQHASWQPGLVRGTPIDELSRRMALHEYQALRLPLAQGSFDAMVVRSVPGADGAPERFDVRLPTVPLPEPLFLGRPMLRITRVDGALTITQYGEE